MIEAMYVAIDTHDLDALGRLFRADAVYERPGARPLVGRDAIISFYARDRKIASGKHVVEHIAITEPIAAAWGSFSGRRVEGWTLELCFSDGFMFDGNEIRTRRSHVYFAPRA